MKKINNFIRENLHWIIVVLVGLLCAGFMIAGVKNENGYITLDGKDAQIQEYTTKFIEDSNAALFRIMNEDAPTDEATIQEFKNGGEAKGLGGSVTLDTVISRREPDGFNDDGKGLQCSKYTAYLATERMEYSYSHPDYGPVNGKDVAQWLVDNFGWKYIDTPVAGAIGSGGFNTLYGHTAMFLYFTGTNTAMVNDANYVPLTVATHNMNIDGWVWVVPGDYTPDPEPTPTPTPTPSNTVTYSYVPGDYFSGVLVKLGLDENNLWGENGTVRYYTGQLIEQDVLDANGNVLLYTPFTLTRR
jgi:hypothetical protein